LLVSAGISTLSRFELVVPPHITRLYLRWDSKSAKYAIEHQTKRIILTPIKQIKNIETKNLKKCDTVKNSSVIIVKKFKRFSTQQRGSTNYTHSIITR
jgi:hypothetical protein